MSFYDVPRAIGFIYIYIRRTICFLSVNCTTGIISYCYVRLFNVYILRTTVVVTTYYNTSNVSDDGLSAAPHNYIMSRYAIKNNIIPRYSISNYAWKNAKATRPDGKKDGKSNKTTSHQLSTYETSYMTSDRFFLRSFLWLLINKNIFMIHIDFPYRVAFYGFLFVLLITISS